MSSIDTNRQEMLTALAKVLSPKRYRTKFFIWHLTIRLTSWREFCRLPHSAKMLRNNLSVLHSIEYYRSRTTLYDSENTRIKTDKLFLSIRLAALSASKATLAQKLAELATLATKDNTRSGQRHASRTDEEATKEAIVLLEKTKKNLNQKKRQPNKRMRIETKSLFIKMSHFTPDCRNGRKFMIRKRI